MSIGSSGSFRRRQIVSRSIATLTLFAVEIRLFASGHAPLGAQPADWCRDSGPLRQTTSGSCPRQLPESCLGQAIVPKGPGIGAEFDESGLKSYVEP